MFLLAILFLFHTPLSYAFSLFSLFALLAKHQKNTTSTHGVGRFRGKCFVCRGRTHVEEANQSLRFFAVGGGELEDWLRLSVVIVFKLETRGVACGNLGFTTFTKPDSQNVWPTTRECEDMQPHTRRSLHGAKCQKK